MELERRKFLNTILSFGLIGWYAQPLMLLLLMLSVLIRLVLMLHIVARRHDFLHNILQYTHFYLTHQY